MEIDDAKFDNLMTIALYRAAELDYADTPSDEALEQTVQPSPRFLRRMNALLGNPHRYIRSQRRPAYIKAMRIAAAVVISFAVLLGASMAVSPTVRAGVFSFVRSWFEDRTAYTSTNGKELGKWEFGYIPEGFELVLSDERGMSSTYIYENSDSVIIMIEIAAGGKKSIDNEHAEIYQIKINGRDADVYESNDPGSPNGIVLLDDVSGNIISVISHADLNETMRIAENIRLK